MLLAAPLLARVQTGNIVGRVLDGGRGTPLSGAVVEVIGTPTRIATNTSIDGRNAGTSMARC